MRRVLSWLSSLHFLLIVGFTLVLAVSLVGVSLYVRHATDREIGRFEREVEQVRAQRIESIVASHHVANQGLSGIGPVLDQAERLYNWNIEVTDPEGGEIVYPVTKALPAEIPSEPLGPGSDGESRQSSFTYVSTIQDQGKEIAAIEIVPATPPGSIPEPPLSRVLATLDASLLWAGLAAGVFGIALVSLLTRRALSSIGTLRLGARTLGRGEYSHRVPELRPREIGELGQTFNAMATDMQRAEQQRLKPYG